MKKTTKRFGYNAEKFSFGQLTSNTNGKTSATGTAGLYIIAVGGICFLLGCIDKMFLNENVDIITQSIIFVGIGAGLLGYRKSKQNDESPSAVEETVEETPSSTPVVTPVTDSDVIAPIEDTNSDNTDSQEDLKPLNS